MIQRAMETAIRATRRASEANEWALVLTALRIPHRVEMDGDVWLVLVPDAAVRRGRAALRAHDEEGQRAPDQAPAEAASSRTAWITGLAAGALLFGFFFVTGPPAASSSWAARGAAVSRSMLNGEPWRAVTALTLHVDLLHVLGNTIATALLLPPIVRRLGPGIGLALVLLAGAAANLLGAWVQGPQHVAVGASTATFGALGILAALRQRSASPVGQVRGRRWIVPVTSVLLLAMLGTGPGTDVIAHALGLVVGAALGLAAASSDGRWRRRSSGRSWRRGARHPGCWCAAGGPEPVGDSARARRRVQLRGGARSRRRAREPAVEGANEADGHRRSSR